MNTSGWIQLALFVAAVAALTKPMGLYLGAVLEPDGRGCLHRLASPLERWTYRLCGIDPSRPQDWRGYTLSMLGFSLASCLFTYAILRVQHRLPLNPEGLGPVAADLAFNTAVSFTTNTNWQSYAGESTLSYLSQMVALTLQNFASASVGIGIAAALVRGLTRHATRDLGNFWADLVRVTYRLLLPLSTVFAVFLVSQGMIQNFQPHTRARLIEPYPVTVERKDGRGTPVPGPDGRAPVEERTIDEQAIAQGPMASQVAIKMLGTNGGGFTNANAAHPFENPTPLSNLLQMLSIFAIGAGLTYHLGRMTRHPGHGWSVWAAMMSMFVAGTLVSWWAEAQGNPIHTALGIDASDGNLEGKEVRFGVFNSALFATVTTAASCGAVNAMHDSFTALGGLVPLFNIELGEVVIGGVGAGLYGMLVFVVLAVFIAGLMIGRTPEYLGKKINAYDVKMAMLALLVPTATILGLTALAIAQPWGLAGLNNAGPHGLSEILYAYSSAAGNNGSAFAGLSANTAPYNVTLALAMLAGRFLMIIPIMALAGSLARKRTAPAGAGSFPVAGGTFVVLLIGTILLVGALNFLPALALGPIVEHFVALHGQVY